jgi:hypothetical protein
MQRDSLSDKESGDRQISEPRYMAQLIGLTHEDARVRRLAERRRANCNRIEHRLNIARRI